MTRMKKLACSVGLILVGTAPVAADGNSSPKNLRMRPSNKTAKTTPAHWLPFHRIGKRVAQAPDQPQPPPPDQPPANPPDQTPPANPPQPDQTPPPPDKTPPPANPEQQPNVGQTPNLTDEELAKLAEQETQGEEIISVTGSL